MTKGGCSMTKRTSEDINWGIVFIDKMYQLYNEDGMMRCLYKLFKSSISANEIEPSELTLLSIIQDEYKKVYDQYYFMKKVTDTAGLDRILSDKAIIHMEKNKNTHPMIITYLRFIRADRMYFTGDYDGAILSYQKAYTKIMADYNDHNLSDIDKRRCAYLQNAIAWSYRLRNKEDDNKKAIEIYRRLFDEYTDIDQYYFSWKYRRNYGACLENARMYMEAIEQYKKVMGYMEKAETDNNGEYYEYKPYITYCSALMKYWDQETGKLSGKWVTNVKEMYKDNRCFLSDSSILDIMSKLEHVNKITRNIDLENMMPDYYNQITKVLTYKMIISSNENDRDECINEIKKNLTILEDISSKAMGRHYIKRDFYYALYELLPDKDEKEKCLQIASEENIFLNGIGDAGMFGQMLESKKNMKQ